jgi:hypothetical protein
MGIDFQAETHVASDFDTVTNERDELLAIEDSTFMAEFHGVSSFLSESGECRLLNHEIRIFKITRSPLST